MQDLLLVSDPDWAKASAGDPEFILRATGDTIRNYCGWHISPSITETVRKREVGSNGIIMLPSLYVTDVHEVVFHDYQPVPYYPSPPYSEAFGNPYPGPYVIQPGTYRWFQEGYIEPADSPYASVWGYLPNTSGGYADVTLTHGYECVPNDIKMVAYELAQSVLALHGDSGGGGITAIPGGVTGISSPGFSLTLGGSASSSTTSIGMNLNDDQKERLADYKIGGVA
jgi:hypothetical protein